MLGALTLLETLERLLLLRGCSERIPSHGDVRLAAGHLAGARVPLRLDVFRIDLASPELRDADLRHLACDPTLLGHDVLETGVEQAHPSLTSRKALGSLRELVARHLLLALAQRAHALEAEAER